MKFRHPVRFPAEIYKLLNKPFDKSGKRFYIWQKIFGPVGFWSRRVNKFGLFYRFYYLLLDMIIMDFMGKVMPR
ncbi:MAG: hypothetical protein DRP46_12965 [Candidatus Zixiibacteriota bacterium]|nr:MAG: hypothetical protein DRP46_12965 [candidate division Zixibacteria bacterium]